MEAIASIPELDQVLDTLAQTSGMETIILAHVEDATWQAWAVRDIGGLGIRAGDSRALEDTFCERVFRDGTPVVVSDASRDTRFKELPAHTELGICSYVGVPFLDAGGTIVGTICAVDRRVHIGLEAVLRTFELLARLVAHELHLVEHAREAERAFLHEVEVASAREHFLAVVAHDLRNPLAAIETTASLLARNPAAADRVLDSAQRLLQSAARMRRLIDDLLDFVRGRLGSGIPIVRAPIDDASEFVASVVDQASRAHPLQEVVLDMHIPSTTLACWDRDRIAQALENVIANACEHGAGRAVRVHARVEGTDAVIDVVNDGEISAEARLSLFEPFRGSRNPRRGLGLGLYIAERILRAHEGRIDIGGLGGATHMRLAIPLAIPLAVPLAS